MIGETDNLDVAQGYRKRKTLNFSSLNKQDPSMKERQKTALKALESILKKRIGRDPVRGSNIFTNLSVIFSVAGGTVQNYHADGFRRFMLNYRNNIDLQESHSCILGLEDESRLDFMAALEASNGSNDVNQHKTVVVKPGELLIFNGAMIHRGLNYPKDNKRIHRYTYKPAENSAINFYYYNVSPNHVEEWGKSWKCFLEEYDYFHLL